MSLSEEWKRLKADACVLMVQFADVNIRKLL